MRRLKALAARRGLNWSETILPVRPAWNLLGTLGAGASELPARAGLRFRALEKWRRGEAFRSLDVPVLFMVGKRSTPSAHGVSRLLGNAAAGRDRGVRAARPHGPGHPSPPRVIGQFLERTLHTIAAHRGRRRLATPPQRRLRRAPARARRSRDARVRTTSRTMGIAHTRNLRMDSRPNPARQA